MKSNKKIGLVLSGGGFKGVAHIGVLQALEEFNLQPKYISGTSAGAIVGAIYAAGHSPEEIKEFFKQTSLFKFNRFTTKKAGFLDSDKFESDLFPFLSKGTFESLDKKLYVTATNLVEGISKVFNSGELLKPLLASAAFPGVFSPILIDGELYADGGILDNFPIKPIKKKSDLLIGVDVSPIKKPKISDFKTSFNVMQRAYYLRATPNAQTKFKHCEIVIQPKKLIHHGLFSNNGLDSVYQMGYQEAKKAIELYLNENDQGTT